MSDDDNVCVLEELLDKRVLVDGQTIYRCKWRDEVDTWEPAENIYCTQMIVDFEDMLLDQSRPAAEAVNATGIEHAERHVHGGSLKRMATEDVIVMTENHGWSAVVLPGRAACLAHEKRTDRCRECSLQYCSEHKTERIACASCDTSSNRVSKLCQKHKPFPSAKPISAALAAATAASQYHAAVLPCKQLTFRADTASVFRQRVRVGSKLTLEGAETVTVVSRKTTRKMLSLEISPALRRPYARKTCVYSVQPTDKCWECSKLRRPKKKATTEDSVKEHLCYLHTKMTESCKVCKARFATCDKHLSHVNACKVCK